MAYYIHKQEKWTAEKCLKMSRRVFRDGLGTPGGPLGLISNTGSAYPQYGDKVRYNGGCVRDGQWYEGEEVPLPKIPKTFRFRHITSWGTIIEKKS